ncbi:MAG: hypothetical protein V4722_00345 [Bacteroidota bacterium]
MKKILALLFCFVYATLHSQSSIDLSFLEIGVFENDPQVKAKRIKKVTLINNVDNEKATSYSNWYNINGELTKRVEYFSKADSLDTNIHRSGRDTFTVIQKINRAKVFSNNSGYSFLQEMTTADNSLPFVTIENSYIRGKDSTFTSILYIDGVLKDSSHGLNLTFAPLDVFDVPDKFILRGDSSYKEDTLIISETRTDLGFKKTIRNKYYNKLNSLIKATVKSYNDDDSLVHNVVILRKYDFKNRLILYEATAGIPLHYEESTEFKYDDKTGTVIVIEKDRYFGSAINTDLYDTLGRKLKAEQKFPSRNKKLDWRYEYKNGLLTKVKRLTNNVLVGVGEYYYILY